METFYEATPKLLKQSSIALGFFDGVHPGHKIVISKAVEEAKRIGVTSGVVTFKDHPRTLTQGSPPLLLTVIEQRLELFEKLNVETVLVLSFTEELCKLSPKEYIQTILLGSMGARAISVGHNHHFGRNREGTPRLLQDMGNECGFSVHVAQMVQQNGLEVSSSLLRELVSEGNVALAKKFLERPYAILGDVVRGDQRGKMLGFPTANLKTYEYQLLPRPGVYAGIARLSDNRRLVAVINVGRKPTFTAGLSGQIPLVGEVHILDFDEDIYDTKLQFEFYEFLRNEQKFDGIENLKDQITADCLQARKLMHNLQCVDAGG